jgi:hypothetical protein
MINLDEGSTQSIFAAATFSGLEILEMSEVIQYHAGVVRNFPSLILYFFLELSIIKIIATFFSSI